MYKKAETLGVSTTGKARPKYQDDFAASKNLPDRFALRKEYEDDRAARQLDPTATRHDLSKIQKGEIKLAKELGVSVEEIRRRRRQPNPASPEPSFPESNQRQRTPSPDTGEGMTQRIRVGE